MRIISVEGDSFTYEYVCKDIDGFYKPMFNGEFNDGKCSYL